MTAKNVTASRIGLETLLISDPNKVQTIFGHASNDGLKKETSKSNPLKAKVQYLGDIPDSSGMQAKPRVRAAKTNPKERSDEPFFISILE